MQPLMKTAPPSRDAFVPDFSEGAEVGVYLALLELIDEGLLIIGDETIIDANSAACRLLGRSYRQLAGQPLADLFADGHAFLDARKRLLIQGEARGTLGLVLPDGRVHMFSYIAAPRLRPGIHAIVLGYDRLTDASAPKLHFQPQVHIRSGRLHAGEVVRRQDSPAFDGFAALAAAATWPHVREHAPVISINITAEQIPGGNLPNQVSTALAANRFDPRKLELSIDARVLALPESEIAPTLQTLDNMRVRLALDNFGSDPVPLAQLTRYRFSVLKLDAVLTAQVGRDDDSTALIEAIIHMATPLGIQIMARGVQTGAQRDFLLALGCELQQGPLIGAAQDEHLFASFLSERLFC
jgi:EAL domain-containing protein (putative c-di-GMP-specific phosphodiesterase class I)